MVKRAATGGGLVDDAHCVTFTVSNFGRCFEKKTGTFSSSKNDIDITELCGRLCGRF